MLNKHHKTSSTIALASIITQLATLTPANATTNTTSTIADRETITLNPIYDPVHRPESHYNLPDQKNDVNWQVALEYAKRANRETTDTVLLTGSRIFADSLSSSSLQGIINAPLLLTNNYFPRSTIVPEVLDYLKTQKTKNVIILGNKDAVSLEAENQLHKNGFKTVRLGGPSRVETSIKIYEYLKQHGQDVNKIVVVNGDNYGDVLAAGAYAANNHLPVLITRKTPGGGLHPEILKLVTKERPSNILIVGGKNAVDDMSQKQLETTSTNVVRASGETRVETSLALTKMYPESQVSNGLLLTRGDINEQYGWANGMTMAREAATKKQPIVVTQGVDLHPSVKYYVKSIYPKLVETNKNKRLTLGTFLWPYPGYNEFITEISETKKPSKPVTTPTDTKTKIEVTVDKLVAKQGQTEKTPITITPPRDNYENRLKDGKTPVPAGLSTEKQIGPDGKTGYVIVTDGTTPAGNYTINIETTSPDNPGETVVTPIEVKIIEDSQWIDIKKVSLTITPKGQITMAILEPVDNTKSFKNLVLKLEDGRNIAPKPERFNSTRVDVTQNPDTGETAGIISTTGSDLDNGKPGKSGKYEYTVRAYNNKNEIVGEGPVEITIVNTQPQIDEFNMTLHQNTPGEKSFNVVDIDGDTVTVSWENADGNGIPQGLSITTQKNPDGNSMSKTVVTVKGDGTTPVGVYNMKFTVSDGDGEPVESTKKIVVERVNQPPAVKGQFVNMYTVKNGEEVPFNFTAVDPDSQSGNKYNVRFRTEVNPDSLPASGITVREPLNGGPGDRILTFDISKAGAYDGNLVAIDEEGAETVTPFRVVVFDPPTLTVDNGAGSSDVEWTNDVVNSSMVFAKAKIADHSFNINGPGFVNMPFTVTPPPGFPASVNIANKTISDDTKEATLLVSFNDFDKVKPGDYTIRFRVKDSMYGVADADFKVRVVEPNKPPTIIPGD